MIKKIIAVVAALFIAFSVVGCAPSTNHDGVVIENAWVRSSEYSAVKGGMTGIFGKFTNRSDKSVTILGGSTDVAMMAQTHEVTNGVMKEKMGGIEIKPGETVILEPGGLHIMIMNIAKPIVAGDKITFTFKFDGAEPQTLTIPAKDSAGGDETYTK